jgi:hypothetical protein
MVIKGAKRKFAFLINRRRGREKYSGEEISCRLSKAGETTKECLSKQ